MNLKEKLAQAPKVAEKKDTGNAWNAKKIEMERMGRAYAPIWLDSRIIETAKSIAKRLRCRYEDVLDAALTSADNYKVFHEEMQKVAKPVEK